MAEPPFALADDPDQARRRAQDAFEVWRSTHAPHLPDSAQIVHVGATAIAACETKGDLDIAVRVPPEAFRTARAYLDATHLQNRKSVRTETFAAYEVEGLTPPTGVQLVVIGSELDVFLPFCQALRADAALVDRYNALKRAHQGRPMAEYRAAKSAFIRDVLAAL